MFGWVTQGGKRVGAWLRACRRWLSQPGPRLITAYVMVGALLRADFIWLGDQSDVYWRAASSALPAGALQDAGCAVLVWLLIPDRWRAWRLALLAVLVALASVNLSVMAALNVPADTVMLNYLVDPFETTDIESPVAIAGSVFRLFISVGAFVLLARSPRQASARFPFSRRLASAALGIVFIASAQALATVDRRTMQVSHADGASWLWFQTRSVPFALPPDTNLRAAILTPTASRGERFVSDHFPLVRGTPHALCQSLPKQEGCDVDRDGDGFSLAVDCKDDDATVHPGAEDLPADGRDQDCSGTDSLTPNVLVLELEGLPARVLSHGKGESDPIAPELERLTARADARHFTQYQTAGVQTAPGFVSAVCSLLPHYGAVITRAYPELAARCLPRVLNEVGYQTLMLQNGDPHFDHQGEFAKHIGFEHVEGANEIERALGSAPRVSKWGLLDEALFARIGQLLGSRTPHDPPLFVLAQSITNHHPYALPDPSYDRGPATTPTWRKVRATSRYVDEALGRLIRSIDALEAAPGRRPLLVVLSGDHGHPGELHARNVLPASALYAENVHTPLVLWSPGHPNLLRSLTPQRLHGPCSSVDVMPTLLGLLDIQVVHASMGRNLAVAAPPADERAISVNPIAGGLVRLSNTQMTVITRSLPPGIEVYRANDDAELNSLGNQVPGARAAANTGLSAVFASKQLIESNRIWSDAFDQTRRAPGTKLARKQSLE